MIKTTACHDPISISIFTLILFIIAAMPSAGIMAADEPVIHIKAGQSQLFIDDELIESQIDVRRTLHQPTKDNGGNKPLIAARKGEGILAYGTIVFDARLNKYVMIAQDFPGRKMLRATSTDGMNWSARTHDAFEIIEMDYQLGPLPPEAKGNLGIDLFSCF